MPMFGLGILKRRPLNVHIFYTDPSLVFCVKLARDLIMGKY